MESKDTFEMKVAGSLLAIRAVLAALLRNHPDPENLLADIKGVLGGKEAHDGELPGSIQVNFDEIMQEFTSHLYTRIK